MLDYEVLCQAIVDWRAGRRPSVPPPTSEPRAQASGGYAAAAVSSEAEEVDSGLLEDAELAEGDGEQYESPVMYGAPSSHDTLPGPRASDIDVEVE